MRKLFSRDFLLLLLAQVFSLIGNYTLKFALSMYILEKTGSAMQFASLMSPAVLSTLLLSPLGGVLADRANRRVIMVTLDALSGASVLIAALLMPLGAEMTVIGALLVMLSVPGAFESPTAQACVPQLAPPEHLMRCNALVGQAEAVIGLVSPLLGSLLYAAVGLLPVMHGAVVCFLLTAGFECLLHLPAPLPQEKQGMLAILRQDLADCGRFLTREEPGVLRLLGVVSVVNLFMAGLAGVGFPFLMRTVLGLSASHYGAAESLLGFAAIAGSAAVSLLSAKQVRSITAPAIALTGGCMVLLGLGFCLPIRVMPRFVWLSALFAVGQFLCSVFSIGTLSAIQGKTPTHMMGKMMACITTLSLCCQPIGQMLYGVLFDVCLPRPYLVLLPSGLLLGLIGLAAMRFFHRFFESIPLPE